MNLFSGKLLAATLALAALLMPDVAHAFPFTPTGGDKSVQWFLQGLFGELAGGGSDPLRGIIGIFNGAVLCVGGILLFYTLIAGTMQTAHDGEVLGKRWSSLWLPVRTALGVAAIIPINGGYALIQYAVIWLALQGIGIADRMTAIIVGDLASANNQYTFTAASIKPEIVSLVRQMVMNSACVSAINDDLSSNEPDTIGLFNINPANRSNIEDRTNAWLSDSGLSDFHSYRYGCGSIAFPAQELGDNAANLQLIDLVALSQLRQAMWQTHRAQKDSAIQQAGQLGLRIAQAAKEKEDEMTVRNEIDAAIDRIANAWANAAVQTAQSQSQELLNQKLVERITDDGWIVLGSWYLQVTLAQQTISESLAVLPEVSIPDSLIDGAREQTKPGGAGIMGVVGSVVRWAKGEEAFIAQDAASSIMYAVRITDAGGGDTALSSPGSSSPKGILASVTRKFTRAMSGVDLKGSNKNPVILASEIGGRLVVSISIAIGVMTVLAGIAGATATVGTNIVIVLVSILSPLLVALLGAGLTLSYYIPMLPYILWLGAVFGWVVLIVEAVIAAPLWAVTHLAPDGDGVVGRGGQGYMLVLSLTLRPGLMVFGFGAAVAVMNPMGLFLNETFMGTFFASVSPGLTGMLKILAGSVIYAVLMIMIINRVFSLIHQIPDGILRWIGGGDNVIGREANEATAGAGRAIAASTAAAGAAGAMSGAAQQMGASVRQKRMENAQKLQGNAASAAQLAGNEADRSSRGIRDAGVSADRLNDSVGHAGFEERASAAERQTDAAAVSAVGAVAADARSVIANYESRKEGDPGRPTASEVADARRVLDSIEKHGGVGAKSSPEAAREWLSSSSSKFSGTRFGAQINNSAGNVASVDGKLSDLRAQHRDSVAKGGADARPGNAGDPFHNQADRPEGGLDDPDRPA